MISLEMIESEIIELEKRDTSYAVMERLAWLYIVRDHLNTGGAAEGRRTDSMTGGEFIQACSDVPYTALMDILAEHMEAVRAVFPAEYKAVIRRINELKAP